MYDLSGEVSGWIVEARFRKPTSGLGGRAPEIIIAPTPQSPPTHTDLMDHKESQSSRVMLEWRFRQDRGEHDKPLARNNRQAHETTLV